MMKPSVGLTVLTSSPMIFLTIVVLPALSSPLDKRKKDQQGKAVMEIASYSIKILISLSLSLALRRTDNILVKGFLFVVEITFLKC